MFSANLQIRPAAAADIPAIASCLAEAFAPYRDAYTPAAFADTVPTADGVRFRLQEMHVLVATKDGKVVGTISAISNVDHGHLRGMAVLPECHGTGVAGNLLAMIENWLRSRGCNHVTLDTTLPLVAAIKFYEKNGYRRSGTITDFYSMPLIEYGKQL